MQRICLLLVLLFSLTAQAGIEHAPPNFDFENKKAVWVDFKKAHYQITYNTQKKVAIAISTIIFEQLEDGYPLFDLISSPFSVSVNGEETIAPEISLPDQVSLVRMVDKKLKAGVHTLTIKSQIETGVKFSTPRFRKKYKRVSSAFWVRDLTDRMFLERYLPTNLEYDNYKMFMDVEVTGTKRWHSLFANGKVTKLTNNHYQVEFPDWYRSSSVYFHIIPINKFARYYLKYKSIDGRTIPVTIYSRHRFINWVFKKFTWRIMKELERDYGPYPHEQLIIYGRDLRGGMEYAGATETSLIALGHELQHMYFAKGMHPANGNSGWMDEAIASWRDKGHKMAKIPNYDGANLGNHNVYTRATDKRSYALGRSFIGYLDYTLKDAGLKGMKDFLRKYHDKRRYQAVTTQDFISDLETYAQMSFDEDFRKYIFTEANSFQKEDHKHVHTEEENLYHPPVTQEQLDSIL